MEEVETVERLLRNCTSAVELDVDCKQLRRDKLWRIAAASEEDLRKDAWWNPSHWLLVER